MKLFIFLVLGFLSTRIFAEPSKDVVLAALSKTYDLNSYREVRVEPSINDQKSAGGVHRAIVMLFSKHYHHFERVALDFDAQNHLLATHPKYRLAESEKNHLRAPHCPDMSTQFIAIAPNDDKFELGVAMDIANAARSHNLKVVELLEGQATKQNWLDYMSCPALIGNFYDGDANPEEIVTSDGTLTAPEMRLFLKKAFRQHVTNIWLACEAFNNPIRKVVETVAGSQKYGAGKNNLEIGPSDRAASCAMKAALDGLPLTSSFEDCYRRYDTTKDKWGFSGGGSEFFGY